MLVTSFSSIDDRSGHNITGTANIDKLTFLEADSDASDDKMNTDDTPNDGVDPSPSAHTHTHTHTHGAPASSSKGDAKFYKSLWGLQVCFRVLRSTY